MEKDFKNLYDELKKDYLELERVHQDEREGLLKVINTLGVVLRSHEELKEEYRALESVVNTEEGLPLDLIEKEVLRLKDRIIESEREQERDEGELESLEDLKERLLETCRTIKRMMIPILEDFYPLNAELAAKAGAVDIDCQKELEERSLQGASSAFLAFVGDLREKISEDFNYINRTFLTLLDQVKELELTLTAEFGGDRQLKQIESFEKKMSVEMGSITDSFDIHSTISEIKNTVAAKIENIKKLVALKKKEETRKAQKARKNISKLKKRISKAEKAALEMSKKAKIFKTAAMKDGLTGLENRKALDLRIKAAIEAFNEGGDTFAMIFFDLNDFKMINDNFGHTAGDKVLVKVAQCLKETFRKNDFIARYGGDEFAILVDGLTEGLAEERIVSLRKNLKKRRFVSYEKGDINITVSAGFTMVQEGDTPETLIRRADELMYDAKVKEKKGSFSVGPGVG